MDGKMTLEQLVHEYRPTMDAEVLHSWAADVVAAAQSHLTQPAQAVDVVAIREVIDILLADGAPFGVEPLAQKLTRAIGNAQSEGWISVKDRLPDRNKPAIYWHKSEFGGFLAVADEWRDEHHLQYASHWKPYTPPRPEE